MLACNQAHDTQTDLHLASTAESGGRALADTGWLQASLDHGNTGHLTSVHDAGRGEENTPGAGLDAKPLSLAESLRVLANSQQIRCLGVMALAQGLTTNLVDIVWKTHLHMLHPDPARYAVRPC